MSNSETGINKVLTDIALCGKLEATSFRRDSDLLREVLRDVSKLDEPMKQLRKINDDARREKSGHTKICEEYWDRGLDCQCIPEGVKDAIRKGAKPEDVM